MNLSTGSVIFKNSDVYCIFNRFTLHKFYIKQKDFENPSPSILKKLEKLKLINASINLRKFIEDNSKPNFSIMYLLLTDSCNLQCKYCFVEPGFIKHNGLMPLETAFKAVDLFHELAKKSGVANPKIVFYGGEPTLNREVLVETIKYAKNYGMIFNIVTNGTLMDEELAKFLIENNVNISISIDGPEEIHDKKRVYLNGSGSFEKAMNAYNIIKKNGGKLGISCTLSNHNINNIEKIIFFFNEIGMKSFNLNFLNINPNDSLSNEELSNAFIKIFVTTKIFEMVETRIFERHLKPFIEESFHLKDCAATGGQIVVLPSGKVGTCQGYAGSEKYFVKTVDDPVESFFSDNVFKKWAERFPLNMEACSNCNAIGICGGGCACYAEQTKGGIEKPDERFCVVMNDFLDFIIWDYYSFTHPFKKSIEIDGKKILIREIREDDEGRIAKFWLKLKPQAPFFRTDVMIRTTDFASRMVKKKKNKRAYCLVALCEGEIIGFCNYNLEWENFKKGDLRMNLGIAILSDFRQKGLGLEMVNEVVREVKRNKLNMRFETNILNIPMQKLAEKAGFKFEGIDKDHKVYFLE